MPYIAIGQSNDPTIYGTGLTAEEARVDAVEWIDRDSDPEDLTVVECTYGLHHRVRAEGACRYNEIHGVAYTEDEAEAIGDGFALDLHGVVEDSIELDGDYATRMGVTDDLGVMLYETRMVVTYETVDGRRGEIADEPSEPEAQARMYRNGLRDLVTAATDLLEVALKRDAEVEAEAA